MRFQTIGHRTTDIFKPGTLFNLLDEIREGTPAKECKQLTPDELATIPAIYATLDPLQDITAIPDEEEITTGNDKVIMGKDLKAITMLMYLKPRTAYCKFGKEVQYRSAVSGAVPLPMLGFKRYRKIPYEYWHDQIKEELSSVVKGENKLDIYHVFKPDALEKIFKIDLLLGKTLASTYYDPVDDTIKLNEMKDWGLVLLSAFRDETFRPQVPDVRYFRVAGMGNYSGNMATRYGAAAISSGRIPAGVNERAIALHNKASTPMKLLLAQRWAWYGMHRSSDAINDYRDWDNMPKNLDNMSGGFVGVAPLAAEGGNSGKSVFGV